MIKSVFFTKIFLFQEQNSASHPFSRAMLFHNLKLQNLFHKFIHLFHWSANIWILSESSFRTSTSSGYSKWRFVVSQEIPVQPSLSDRPASLASGRSTTSSWLLYPLFNYASKQTTENPHLHVILLRLVFPQAGKAVANALSFDSHITIMCMSFFSILMTKLAYAMVFFSFFSDNQSWSLDHFNSS